MQSWQPLHSPYPENPDHRHPPPDLGPQSSYPPAQPYPPPPSREGSGYAPDPAYSRHNSVSAPVRSPAEPPRPQYPPPSSTPHDQPPYYPQPGLPEYHRPANIYGGPEAQPNGTHPPLHVQTGQEMMQGPPAGHPPHPAYGPPPPHSAGPPQTPGPYPYFYENSQRRKPVRAAQACDSCRQRKAKCDEGRPECQHCKENHLKCTYREIPPQKSEKQVLAITEQLQSLTQNVEQVAARQKIQDEKILKMMESIASQLGQNPHAHRAPDSGVSQSTIRPAPVHLKSDESQVPLADQDLSTSFDEKQTNNQDQVRTQYQDPEPELAYSMPPKHTTAVHNLMEWPAIRALIPKDLSTMYVMDLELKRGQLRLYGSGEGEDRDDGHEGAPSPAPSSSSDGRRVEDEMNSTSPHIVWGTGQLPERSAIRDHPGGLSPHGGLMLESQTVDRLFGEYMDNLHILHPFLEPKVIKKMVGAFKRKYSWDYAGLRVMAGAKRKREAAESPSSLDDLGATPGARSMPSPHSPSTAIEHSVSNAIILLVLALGKICEHKAPLPGPVHGELGQTSTPNYGLPQKIPKSSPSSPHGSAMEVNGNTPQSVNQPTKNMDVIPGLAYYAKAADILGELTGGADVSHVQANLLAGLYMGQLARINSSHSYISAACRACIILIESTEYKQGATDVSVMSRSRRNLINFAFWTCLQLESDLLAEVELPPSGITRYEGRQHQEIPSGVTLDPIPETNTSHADILRYYSYQVQLRRTMNDVHSMIYGKKAAFDFMRPMNALTGILVECLQQWRAMLSDWNWEDDYHLDSNINTARMRAKYYGARYIIHRPSLALLLRNSPPQTPVIKHTNSPHSQAGLGSSYASPVLQSDSPAGRGRQRGGMGPPARSSEVDPKVMEAAITCIEAAIRSTTAFDEVPPRLIITNVFGTLHAQFGNMLVLAAAHNSTYPELQAAIPEDVLRRLFARTIKILEDHSQISPTLRKDAEILRYVKGNVFPHG